ncbi:hypothetical protein BJ165DRAFT_343870 [Panaeolus papilionaceus]|nr:hypothetical protein BJ165DRAFT_343870 [Panaeolus papilionaceus]
MRWSMLSSALRLEGLIISSRVADLRRFVCLLIQPHNDSPSSESDDEFVHSSSENIVIRTRSAARPKSSWRKSDSSNYIPSLPLPNSSEGK